MLEYLKERMGKDGGFTVQVTLHGMMWPETKALLAADEFGVALAGEGENDPPTLIPWPSIRTLAIIEP